MILEQAIKQINDKESLIKHLQIDIQENREKLVEFIEKLVEFTEFKYGDKVKVIRTIRYYNKIEIAETVCFVSGVRYKSGMDEIKYKFNKIKKDGTMSK